MRALVYIILIIYSFSSFSHQRLLMVFHRSWSDSKSPKVSRALLWILAEFNDAVVSMASTRPLISKSSSPCTNLLLTIPTAPITIGITTTFLFYIFFQFSSKVLVLIFLLVFFQSPSIVSRESKILNSPNSLFLILNYALVLSSGRDYYYYYHYSFIFKVS